MKQDIKHFASYLSTRRLLNRLFLSLIAIFLLSHLTAAPVKKKSPKYFQNIFLYPLGKIKVDKKIKRCYLLWA